MPPATIDCLDEPTSKESGQPDFEAGQEGDLVGGCRMLSCIACNSSMWGPQALKYFQTTSCEIAYVSEHRVWGDKYWAMQQALGVAGYRMIGVEATRTPKGDASGGVAIVFKDYCH
eukprot:15573284-Heterocapsa_arctica.AAC.1